MSEPIVEFEAPHLQSMIEREQRLLAPYAMRSADSAGRKYPEAEHAYRSPYQRDRDRIVHSAAFRRLSGKMQVFTGEMGDYHRTRLTHTQEVASIARTIGRSLRLNEDLIEALALIHDLGHPPYGHAGEDALDECLRDEGGFSHNRFALTIVEELEVRYPGFPGLNLTSEVLQGQSKRIDKRADSARPLLEVQLVDAADSITYDAHDTDDAVKLGLVRLDDLTQNTLVHESLQRVQQQHTSLDSRLMRKAVVREMVDRQVTDVLNTSARQLQQLDFASPQEAMQSQFLIGPSPELAEQKEELERFLYERVYRHPDLVAVRRRAQDRIRLMFQGYQNNPGLFPLKYHKRAQQIGVRRMAVEYIAGMTDRFCEACYQSHLIADG